MTRTEEITEEKNVKQEKRLMFFGVEFVYVYFFAIGFAFLGWVAENAARVIGYGILDCRFHLLPFISPYALCVLAMHALLKDPDELTVLGKRLFKDKEKEKLLSNVCAFLMICAVVFLGELLIGNFWDLCFGVELWNYTEQPLNVTKYAGLVPTLGYGGGAYLLFKFVYKPVLARIREKVPFKVAKFVTLTLGVLILADTLFMMGYTMIVGEAPYYWSVKLW